MTTFFDAIRAEYQDDPTTIIVTLEPSEADRVALAGLGDLPAPYIHMTLAYLGNVADTPPLDISAVMQAIFTMSTREPIEASVGGFGFLGPNGFAGNTVALIDADGIGEFRAQMVATLSTAGIVLTDEHDFIPHITVAEGTPVTSPESAVGMPVLLNAIGLRYGGQPILIPMTGTPAAPEAAPTEAPAPDAAAPEATPAPADATTPPAPAAASTGAPMTTFATVDELIPGAPVTWSEGDGTIRTGVVIEVITADDGTISVSIAPDDAPDTAIELPLDIVDIIPGAPVAPVPETPDAAEEPTETPAEVAGEVEVDDAAEEVPEFVPWAVVVDHPNCTGPEGTVAVVALAADGSEVGVDSCHMDEASAQARIDDLTAADALEDQAEEPVDVIASPMMASVEKPVAGTATVEVGVSVAGMAELEKAAGYAGQIKDTLGLLAALAPDLATKDAVEAGGQNVVVVIPGNTEVEVSGESEDGEHGEGCECPECGGPEAPEAGIPGLGDMMGAAAAEAAAFAEGAVAEAPVEGDAPVEAEVEYEWEGVLIVEGTPSGDGRQIAENALTWRTLPIPLMLQTVNAAGHDGSVICGSIHKIERVGQNIMGYGLFDSGEDGQKAKRLLSEGTMRGVSADIDSVQVEFLTEEGTPVDFEDIIFGGVEALEVLTAGRIMGATLTPFPAFQEAHVSVINAGSEDIALVASGGVEVLGDVWRVPSPIGAWMSDNPRDPNADLAALVASAAASVEVPVNPPKAWFLPGTMTEPEPFTVHADGRCYGLVARFGSCHIGFSDRCVDVPRTGSAYKHFRVANVLTAEGDLVATGPIFMDTVHPQLRLVASDAQAHYADTGCAVADVALYENEFGIVAAGSLRPGLSAEQVRRFRGSSVSPDWRDIGGRLECVGLLCVNVSGFIVESLVASGASLPVARGSYDSVSGKVTALVAAGMMHPAKIEAEAKEARVAELAEQVDYLTAAFEEHILGPRREAEAAAVRARMGILTPAEKNEAREATVKGLMAHFGLDTVVVGESHPVVEGEGCGGSCGCGGTCSTASAEATAEFVADGAAAPLD